MKKKEILFEMHENSSLLRGQLEETRNEGGKKVELRLVSMKSKKDLFKFCDAETEQE